jgi:hypothetical protein
VIAAVSYPRRLWLRRSLRAAAWTFGVVVSTIAGILLVKWRDGALVVAALAVGVVCGGAAWRERRLARRALIGARSERVVREALRPLQRDGWTARSSVRWPQGDVDHVATAPTGLAFVIETKTSTFSPAHLARTRAAAAWVRRRRRRWAPAGAIPVLCVVRGRSWCEAVDGVIVVSADRLVGVLRAVDSADGGQSVADAA